MKMENYNSFLIMGKFVTINFHSELVVTTFCYMERLFFFFFFFGFFFWVFFFFFWGGGVLLQVAVEILLLFGGFHGGVDFANFYFFCCV